jgi:hypothetical protein
MRLIRRREIGSGVLERRPFNAIILVLIKPPLVLFIFFFLSVFSFLLDSILILYFLFDLGLLFGRFLLDARFRRLYKLIRY